MRILMQVCILLRCKSKGGTTSSNVKCQWILLIVLTHFFARVSYYIHLFQFISMKSYNTLLNYA